MTAKTKLVILALLLRDISVIETSGDEMDTLDTFMPDGRNFF